MKVLIDENLKGKELYKFLVENKSGLIAQKKTAIKTCEPVSFNPEFFHVKEASANKTAIGAIPEDATSIRAKIVANTSMWMDSQKDVLLPDCWAKSIKDKKGRLHLKDHTFKLEAEVGEVFNIYSQDLSLSELGVNKAGVVQVLVYESDVKKSYDEKVFTKYKTGRINQHSISLNYVKLEIAINDEDFKEEFANWNKYIDLIINKEEAEKSGFFWIVPEIKLIECSAVLAGANELTPTLEVGKDTFSQPVKTTEEQPLNQPYFDWSKAIKETQFIKN